MVDRPGCGLSDPLPRPLRDVDDFHRFADEVVADVLDALELERATVVATSFGGCLAVRSAATHPQRFAGMVELGYCFGAPMATVPFPMRVAAVPVLGRLMASVPPPRAAMGPLLRQIGLGGALAAGRISPEFVEWFLTLLRHTDTLGNEVAANPPLITPIRGLNPAVELEPELLARVPGPVAVVWGDDDPLGGVATARDFAACLSGAELTVVAGAGHAPWIDEPELAADAVRRTVAAATS